jgi:hypothetical protein
MLERKELQLQEKSHQPVSLHSPYFSYKHTLDPTTNPHQTPRSKQTRPRITRRTQSLESTRAIHDTRLAPTAQNRKPKEYLQTRNADAQDNENDDDPGDLGHLPVAYTIGKNLAKVKEDLATFVEDLDAWFDLEVFAHCGI